MNPEGPDHGSRTWQIAGVPGLRWLVWMTLAGICAERAVRNLWPAWCALLATYVVRKVAPLVPIEFAASAWIVPAAATALLCIWGIVRLRAPRKAEAVGRIDAGLPERPLSALSDRQATGLDDEVSRSLWNRHLARMSEQAGSAKAVGPDLRLSAFDRWSLRYVCATAFVIAFLFLPDIPESGPAGSDFRLRPASGSELVRSSFDAWVEPPAYTGEPGIYLNDAVAASPLPVPTGSRLSVRLYGDPDGFDLTATMPASKTGNTTGREWLIEADGRLELATPYGEEHLWEFVAIPDRPPIIGVVGDVESGPFGRTSIRFELADDYGVAAADIAVDLDLAGVERIHGLAVEPESTEGGRYRIPLPFGPQRQDIETTFTADFGDHPWGGLPVEFVATVKDAVGQSTSLRLPVPAMPGRLMFHPVAGAVAEQRRDLLWSRENGERVAKVLRAISTEPDGHFDSLSAYLTTRVSIRLLETALADGLEDGELREIAELLWRTALELEEGDLAVSRERLSEVARRLAEAIEEGAPEAEIRRLQEEYRQALSRFMAEMARMAQQLEESDDLADADLGQFGETSEISASEIERLMEELERLLAEGRTEEARRTLDELRRLTENMVAARPGNSGAGNNFRQSMQGFGGTLQRQQGLADEAFRMLQEQRGQEGAGASEGNVGRGGGIGRGQEHFGRGSGFTGSGGEGEVAERQESLRQELRQQMRQLADQGLSGRDAMNSFERAARAMTRARDRLRQNELEAAMADQSEAIQALAQGMRSLAQEFAAQSGDGYGGPPGTGATDPLGRRRSGNVAGSGNLLLPDELIRHRLQELRDEIRQRAGDPGRPDFELNYLKRLLELY